MKRPQLAIGLAFSMYFFNPQAAFASSPCDGLKKSQASLLWAIDFSASMDSEERLVQLDGYSQALSHPGVQYNLTQCSCIEIGVVTWAADASVSLNFHRVDTLDKIERIQKHLGALKSGLFTNGVNNSETNVSRGLELAHEIMAKQQNQTAEMLVTVSGDGIESRTPGMDLLRTSRKELESLGVVVNAVSVNTRADSDFVATPKGFGSLAQALEREQRSPYWSVGEFFEREVITHPKMAERDSYVIEVQSFNEFAKAAEQSVLRDTACKLAM